MKRFIPFLIMSVLLISGVGCASSGGSGGITPTEGLVLEQAALTADTILISQQEASGRIAPGYDATLTTDEANCNVAIQQGFADISANVNNGAVSSATATALTQAFTKLGIDEVAAEATAKSMNKTGMVRPSKPERVRQS